MVQNLNDELFDLFGDIKDTYIEMKCLNCGYEENMPDWCYDEVAEILKLDYPDEKPHIVCPKCNKETLYSKEYTLSKIN